MIYRGKLVSTDDPFKLMYGQISEHGILQFALRYDKPQNPEYGKKYSSKLGICVGLTISDYQSVFDYLQKLLTTELQEVGSMVVVGRSSCLNFASYFTQLNDYSKEWLKPVLVVRIGDDTGRIINEIRSVKPEWFHKVIESSSRGTYSEYAIYCVGEL
jgi:hypothetical protein